MHVHDMSAGGSSPPTPSHIPINPVQVLRDECAFMRERLTAIEDGLDGEQLDDAAAEHVRDQLALVGRAFMEAAHAIQCVVVLTDLTKVDLDDWSADEIIEVTMPIRDVSAGEGRGG